MLSPLCKILIWIRLTFITTFTFPLTARHFTNLWITISVYIRCCQSWNLSTLSIMSQTLHSSLFNCQIDFIISVSLGQFLRIGNMCLILKYQLIRIDFWSSDHRLRKAKCRCFFSIKTILKQIYLFIIIKFNSLVQLPNFVLSHMNSTASLT